MIKDIYSQLNVIQEKIIKNLPIFQRNIYQKINWNFPLIGIVGNRGTGKTTLMLQKLLENQKNSFYFSCDNVAVIEIGLFNLVFDLYNEHNQKEIYIDEIHKYPNWAQELKNLTDSFPELKIIISGSSNIDIVKQSYDLSRRILIYKMPTLSFKEFLELKYKIQIPIFQLKDIFKNFKEISFQYSNKIKNIYLMEYMKGHAYLYRNKTEDEMDYFTLLKNAINKTLYEDIPRVHNLEAVNLPILEKILFFSANMSPSEMSYNKIGQKMKIDHKTAEYYCSILEQGNLINIIKKYDNVTNTLLKDKKIFLSNTNLTYYYNQLFSDLINIGLLRETFFVNAIKRTNAKIFLHSKQDFLIKDKEKIYICEVGGKNKEIKKQENYFVIADNLFIGSGNKIPIWLFGLIEEKYLD